MKIATKLPKAIAITVYRVTSTPDAPLSDVSDGLGAPMRVAVVLDEPPELPVPAPPEAAPAGIPACATTFAFSL